MSFSDQEAVSHPSTAVALTLDTTFDPPLKLLYVGVEGDLVLKIGIGGAAVTYKAVPAGSWISLPVTEIVASGTTGVAADFIGHR
jgi:hypothetical protein